MSRTTRKIRTRQHIIEYLSVNHVERYIAISGYSAERIEMDYGYDLVMFTYDLDDNQNGALESGTVYIQVKATDRIQYRKQKGEFAFSVEVAHIRTWLDEPMPVILVLYDAREDKAYWQYLQVYLKNKAITQNQQKLTVLFSKDNLVDTDSVKLWRRYKSIILAQLEGVIQHHV